MKGSTHSRFQPVEIGQIDGTRAVIEAVPESMSAFGGAPMIAVVEQKVGLIGELAKRIHDPRAAHMVDHKTVDILMQRGCQIAIGYPDGNDCDFLRSDPAILQALNRHPVLGSPGVSQETTSRFEAKAVNAANVESVQNLFIEHYLKEQKKAPKRIELDIDGSIIKTYGAQEGAIYRGGKYEHEMYFPLFMFIRGWLVAATLRMGDQAESSTVLPELKKAVSRLRQKWPRVNITVRMDAAFGSPELYNYCRREHVDYEIALKATSVLDLYAKTFMQQAEQEFRREFGEPLFVKADGTKDGKAAQAEHARVRRLETQARMAAEWTRRQRQVRVVGDFYYQSEYWDHRERVIVRVDYTDKGLNVRYVMVSQQRGIPKTIYEEQYCQRGLMEQFIGKLKQTGHRLSAQTFFANQLRMTLYGVSYQLLFHLQSYLGRDYERWDVNTLRKRILVMPMTIRCTAKKFVVQISEQHPHCKIFLSGWRRLRAA